jgi:molybdate transport system regulatory protein
MIQTRLPIRLDLFNGGQFGPGKIALLEAIRAMGSITAAARQLGVSYSRAWLLIAEINHLLHKPAAIAVVGGQRGGSAVLPLWPPTGERVIKLYRKIEVRIRVAALEESRAVDKLIRGSPASGNRFDMMSASLKGSSRNHRSIVERRKGRQ